MRDPSLNRRGFLGAVGGLVGALGLGAARAADKRPPVTNPRATDGDDRHEPNWEERLTVTVGQKQADLVGTNDKVIQAALDYVARLGGGTVHVLPGTYVLRNAITLPSRVRLLGSGADSVITKIPSSTVALTGDFDWYDQEIVLQDASDFQVGDGVTLITNGGKGDHDVIKRTLIARSGTRFKLNDGIRENLWTSGESTCSSLFPLLTSEHTANVVIENITLDGNREQNENLDGNYAGCIFLQDCNRYTIRKVTTRNYNGDGISFQICHDVTVDSCHSHDNADLGIHPGSGSQRPLIINNRIERNGVGLFWCWGVKYGLAEGNRIDKSSDHGISIGHNDTDNVMRRNEVTNSGKVGVLFRGDNRGTFSPHRNRLEENRIVNSGGDDGVALDIQGKTSGTELIRNEIRETRMPCNRVGIRLAANVGNTKLVDNTIQGFAHALLDQRGAQ